MIKTIIINKKEKDVRHGYRGSYQLIVFKRKRNKETGKLEGCQFCAAFKNILMGSNDCCKCMYHYWGGANKVACKLIGKIEKVFEL